MLLRSFSIITILLSLVFNHSLEAQSKQDYVWLFGKNNDIPPGNESYMFDFNVSSAPIDRQGLHEMEIGGNNASICDVNGNLLMYTNGCQVSNRDHEIMTNGYNLNVGHWLGDTCDVYHTFQDILILDDPAQNNNHYILHKPLEVMDSFNTTKILYTYVQFLNPTSKGKVTLKNEVIFDSLHIQNSFLTAIKHANQRDWWILQPLDHTNKYIKLLINEEGILVNDIQEIGPVFHPNSSGGGTAKFSPDGLNYAYYNPENKLHYYNFDRETGQLSNLRIIDLTVEILLGSIEFSSNSQFIYVSNTKTLWQVDTQAENIQESVELIAEWDGLTDPFLTTFFLMALAPDCKIYMCSPSGTRTYHVINEPNKKGQACDFVQHGIQLPFYSTTVNMPNFPRFRVDEEDKCDPAIGTVMGETVYYRKDLEVWPNPFTDHVNIKVPDQKSGQLFVFDMQGQLVWHQKHIEGSSAPFDLSFLSTGQYLIEFLPDQNTERLIYTKSVVRQ